MYALTAAGRAVQGQSHTTVVRVQVLHGGRPVAEIVGYVTDGTVNADADQPILRSISFTLVDPDGTLSKTDVGELLSPYDAEVKVWRGVKLLSGSPDWVPLGVFRLTETQVTDSDEGLKVSLTGQDRALVYQAPLPGPVVINPATSVERAIQLVLLKVNSGLRWAPWVTGRTVGPLLYGPETQAWEAALTLAESVGGWLYHDRDGVCVMAPYSSTGQSLQRFDKTLLQVSRVEDADEIHNSVIMQSGSSELGVIRVIAEDTDRDSPTFVGSRYGRRQITVTNPHLGTPAQAQEAATARLIQELGRSRTVSWSCVPDVQTDPGDVVIVHNVRAGVLNRRLVVSSVVLPLGVAGAMQVTARTSVISQFGVAV